MKKEIGVLMLLSAVLLSGCVSDKSGAVTIEAGETPSNPVTTEATHESDAKLIAASENEEVKLYALKETEGVIERVTLDIHGQQKEFDWKIIDTGTKPKVFHTDLTSDGKPEAIIIINTGRGTGFNTYDIHILNAEDLSEIKVQNYEEIVNSQIETHVAKNGDDTLAIKVKAQGKEYNFNYDHDPAPNFNQEELAFGGVVIYELENQKVKVRLGASVGISPAYVCDINITYKFDNAKNEFIVDQIEVEPFEKHKKG
ncbi:hypothetical protein ACE3NQ_08490 [Paenibacillus terreus]|uniref:Lipoprotein n=1 Tax=Paenibacillus terreus TaxID=1387834 RepID=A0ABV5B5I3_9BACL